MDNRVLILALLVALPCALAIECGGETGIICPTKVGWGSSVEFLRTCAKWHIGSSACMQAYRV